MGYSRSSHQRCSIKIGALKNIAKFTRKHLCQSLFFSKVTGLRDTTLSKKRLWHRCFPVNFVKLLNITIEHVWWLLLSLRHLKLRINFKTSNVLENLEILIIGFLYPLNPNLPLCKTSKSICSANQFSGFYLKTTLLLIG